MSSMADVEAATGGDGGLPEDPEAPAVVRRLRALDRGVARVEEVIIGLCLLGLILLGVLKAVTLNLFPPSPFWIGEMLRYSVFCIGLVGAALAAQSNRLFNIDQMSKLFSPRGRLIIRILMSLLTIIACAIFFKASLLLRENVADEEGELLAPKWGIISLPAGLALIAFHMGLRAFCDVVYLASGRVPPELKRAQVPHA